MSLLHVHWGHSGHCDVGARAVARPRAREGVDGSCGGIERSRTRVRATVESMLALVLCIMGSLVHWDQHTSRGVIKGRDSIVGDIGLLPSLSEAAVAVNPGSPGISRQELLLSARMSMILGNVSLQPTVSIGVVYRVYLRRVRR